MRKCKYLGKKFIIYNTPIEYYITDNFYYYDIILKNNSYNIYATKNKSSLMSAFSEDQFIEMFIDCQKERKQKLKKLKNESILHQK